MTVLVDADACPVVQMVEKIAGRYGLPVVLLCDQDHELTSDYSKVVRVARGRDAVDYRLVSLCRKGDIVVTQDYGLAAMVMAKGGHAIHHSGMIYSDENIDGLLIRRHIAREARRQGVHVKGPSKRKKKNDVDFQVSFERLIREITEGTGRTV